MRSSLTDLRTHGLIPARTNSGKDATNEVVVKTQSTVTSLLKPSVAVPQTATTASTLPLVSTVKSSLVTPSAMVTPQPATPNAAQPAHSVANVLATVINRILSPSARNTPTAPPVDQPATWVLLAALRRELSGAAVNLDPPSPIKVSPTLTITPVYPETVTGFYNMMTAPPGVDKSIQGYRQFNVVDANGKTGTFYAYESTAPYLTPHLPTANAASVSQVLYVDSGVANLLGHSPATGALPDGSVISIITSAGGAFVNVYSAIRSTTPGGADTVTNILTNTRTGRTIDVSWLVNALGFNAAHVTPALPDYISSDVDPTVTAINGIPPLTIAVQGYQPFEYLGADGATIGHFNALVTTTTDGLGFHTEALLVTGYPDTGAGYAPSIGSVYNTIVFHNLTNVYSSIPQADGTVKITNILTDTSTGKTSDLSWLFQNYNASKGLTDGTNIWAFNFGDGYTIAPTDAQEVFTGVNGLPPGNVSIQGTQVFDVMHGSVSAGTFHADVTTIPKMLLINPAQALLVTDSSSSAVPVGSVFDVRTYPQFGFTNIYSDLVGAGPNGQNLITDTLTTPWGNLDLSWLVQGTDAAAGLNPTMADPLVSFMDGAWLGLFSRF